MLFFDNFLEEFDDDEDDIEFSFKKDQNKNDEVDDSAAGDEFVNDEVRSGEKNYDEAQKNDDEEEDEKDLKVKQLQEEINNLQNLNLRLRAEYDNFKKRTNKEKQKLYSSGQLDCVTEFLPFFDGMERGFETVSKNIESEFFKSFKVLIDSFTQVLKKLEIESFGKKGDVFDPKFHNAIKTLEVDGFGKNLVYEVLQKGYCKGDDIVRHALVVVANP